jgi:hypothetical protein
VVDSIILEAIQGSINDEQKLAIIENQYAANKAALRNAITSWLSVEPTKTAGDLFSWLTERSSHSPGR